MIKYFLLFLSCTFLQINAPAQLNFIDEGVMEGYTLFRGTSVFLVDNCGQVVHSWGPVSPRLHVKLLPNGNIIYIQSNPNRIIERDWDDNLVNDLAVQDPSIRLDYEVIILDNGNYLCAARKDFSANQFMNIGYNYGTIGSPNHVDAVVEIDRNTGATLWQWVISDHVIQQRDESLPNYGILKDHPELLNMDAISTYDWENGESFMINGMDYNPELDHIALSVRKMSEVVIIDHSTTTVEAAGHTGGNSGMGGDILYRWGNPQNYDRGTADDQKLFFQHNPNWVQHGENKGQIAIYDNGLTRPGVGYGSNYSTAPIIDPPLQSDGTYFIDEELPFGPEIATETYGLPGSDVQWYSSYTSAHKVLQNGNILITVGGDRLALEMTPDGSLVWDYDVASNFFNFFRVEKYALDYPAFEGRDLTPSGTIESPPSQAAVACIADTIDTNTTTISENNIKAWVDAGSRQLLIQTNELGDFDLALYNMLGEKWIQFDDTRAFNKYTQRIYSYSIPINISGIFILNIRDKNSSQQRSIKLFLP